MMYKVQVKVMPLNNLLDPQGKAVQSGLANLGLQNIVDVRVGKHIILEIDAIDEQAAITTAENAAKQLLANQVMEFFEVAIVA